MTPNCNFYAGAAICSEETVAKLEENILKMQPISEARSDLKGSDIVEALLDGIGVGDYNEMVHHPFSRLLKDVAFMFDEEQLMVAKHVLKYYQYG